MTQLAVIAPYEHPATVEAVGGNGDTWPAGPEDAMNPARHVLPAFGLVVAATLSLGGCRAGVGTAAAPTPVPSGTAELTYAQFIGAANALCSGTDTDLLAVPRASGSDDYPGQLTYFTKTLTIQQSYFEQLTSLIDRSPDRENLTTHWLDVEQGDFTATVPAINQMIDALGDRDDTAIHAAQATLKKAPFHANQLYSFFTDYGLTDCATMESDSGD